MDTSTLNFTVYTSTAPPALTKVLSLKPDGTLNKTAAATMIRGTAERCTADDLRGLAAQLDALRPNQAVGWGVPIASTAELQIVPDDDVQPDGGAVSRTRRNFAFPSGPGVLMLDHDDGPDGEPLDRGILRAKIVEAIPTLANAPMLWRPSASAGVQSADGQVLTPLHRCRLYIPVTDARAIPEAGKRIVTLLQAAGLFWCEVGAAGQALPRCIVDASVWQPERLDFAAPPVLRGGLQRPAVACKVYGDPAGLFDLAQIVVTGTDEQRARDAVRAARAAVADRCRTQREAWASARAPELARRRSIPVEKAHAVLTRAAEHGVLMGDFMLTAQDGSAVSVGEVLDHASRWHNARFADPLDPDDDRRVAVVNLRSGGRPALYTHRHGGQRFELRRQSARVQIGRGLRIATTDAVLQVLRDRGELYEHGEGALVYVARGRARPVSPEWLTDHLGRACDFYSVRSKPDGAILETTEDAPSAVARAVLSKHGERGFQRLTAVVSAPTLRIDGSVLDVPGFDAASGLLFVTDDPAPPGVPRAPTAADALAALRVLWRPVAGFPFADDVARGVVLSALLTACMRATLPTAPGVALDAPAAGTGKTLLARVIAILATGDEPAILPPAADDDETRKRLFAALRDGSRVLLLDNVREPLGGAALDAFLTAPTFADRVLGASEVVTLPNRALFVATGNNIRLTGDTCRRVLVARLDAQTDTPYQRDFSFCPAALAREQRMGLVAAALTIIRAYIHAGREKAAKGRTASFEVWDDLVRQPVCWLKGLIGSHADLFDLPAVADPLDAAKRAFDADPETTKHRALLQAWHRIFDDYPKPVAEAISTAEAFNDDSDSATQLRRALCEIGGQGTHLNPRVIGRWLERHAGRRIDGLRVERGALSRGLQTWRVLPDIHV